MDMRHPRSAADRDATFEIMRRAFNAPRERRERWLDMSPDELLWGLYDDDGTVVASAKVHDWTQWWGGRSVRLAAVSGVGVDPTFRGRGHASRLFGELLPALRDEGCALSGLMPASTSLYRKLGYEVAAPWSQHAMPTRALHGLPRAPGVRVRAATPEDVPAIAAHEERAGAASQGWLNPGSTWWSSFAKHEYDSGFGYVAVDDAGSIIGDMWFRQKDHPQWGYTVEVVGFSADDVDVLCALWHTVASSSTMSPQVIVTAPMDDALHLLLPEQDFNTVKELRYMLRILDVPAAVSARGYPAGLTASVDLEVRDPIVPVNDGRWRVSVEGGKGVAERGGDGTFVLGVGALASLYSGWSTPALLRSTGLLSDAGDDAVLAAMFAGSRPVANQFF
jgi:predicted acetyltransferase